MRDGTGTEKVPTRFAVDRKRGIGADRLPRVLRSGESGAGRARVRRRYVRKILRTGDGTSGSGAGRVLPMQLIGYFKAPLSERGIDWRCADSDSLREFFKVGLTRSILASTVSPTRRLIDLDTHSQVFSWVPTILGHVGLIDGKTFGVDVSTLEANAAIRLIVSRDDCEGYNDFLTRLAKESVIEIPTRQDLAKRDRKRPNQTWDLNATANVTIDDGPVTVFVVFEHSTAEYVGIHAVKRATTFEALDPVRQGVDEHFGGLHADSTNGLQLRHDHGSQFMSEDFKDEIRFHGIESSPALVREPEGNGCIERFFKTLKEQSFWVCLFPTGTGSRASAVPGSIQPILVDRAPWLSISSTGARTS